LRAALQNLWGGRGAGTPAPTTTLCGGKNLIGKAFNCGKIHIESHIYLILYIITINGHMSSVNLSKRIKELRAKNKLSQDQLSKRANLPFSTLAKIESGYTPNPSMETLIKIADAFGVGIDDLLGRIM